jgi:hypothetical protein
VNPKANLQVVEDVLKEMTTYEEIKMRLLGEFVSLSGLVYGRLFDRRLHVIDPFALNRSDYIVYRGIDPHFVKPSVCVEVAVDREGNEYVVGCFSKDADTEVIKEELAARATARSYRLGWTRCDVSADPTIKALSGRNIFQELKSGKNAIPALFTSDKYGGSIKAGIDQIKKLLKANEKTGKPKLYIFNLPENNALIRAFENMERHMIRNEEKVGIKDQIVEGKFDAHACLRYVHQSPVNWIPEVVPVPEMIEEAYI